MGAPRLTPETLREELGSLDIYLFDQLLKGRLPAGTRILDAGCGDGRNLVFFLRNGYPLWGVDSSPRAVEAARARAQSLAPGLPAERFRVATLDELPFGTASFDAVLASAVLHFARDGAHFRAMVDELWRVLAPGGLLFARLASTIGIEERVEALGDRRYRLPDGSTRFLVDEALLVTLTRELGGELADPIKTTNVQNLRAMTTWCVDRPEA